MSALFENVINEVNAALLLGTAKESGLSWLDKTFGRAETLELKNDSGTVQIPAIYKSSTDYTDLSPNDSIGNFSFFMMSDYDTTFSRGKDNTFEADFDLIFWFNMQNIASPRSLYVVADAVYNLLLSITVKSGRIEVEKVFDNPEKVYEGFNLGKKNKKYLRQPYGALRFRGKMYYKRDN